MVDVRKNEKVRTGFSFWLLFEFPIHSFLGFYCTYFGCFRGFCIFFWRGGGVVYPFCYAGGIHKCDAREKIVARRIGEEVGCCGKPLQGSNPATTRLRSLHIRALECNPLHISALLPHSETCRRSSRSLKIRDHSNAFTLTRSGYQVCSGDEF